jgi:hypothetical protein
MAINDRFKKTTNNNSGAARAGNRYVGIQPRGARGPQDPKPGDYLLEIVEGSYDRSKRTREEYYAATLSVIEADGAGVDEPGTEVRFGQPVTIVGEQVIRDFMMAAHGYEDYDNFNAWLQTVDEATVEDVAGKRVCARVLLGGAKADGGRYVDWEFAPA